LATLTGYGVPTGSIASSSYVLGSPNPPLPKLLRGRLDHAYVVCDDGKSWGCFGRDSGGSPIKSGSGSRACADCLSQPIEPGKRPFPLYAGLKYGYTGVCHQAANRLLKHAGTDVAGVRGYAASVALYGKYGRGSWPQEAQCVSLYIPSGQPLASGGGQSMASSTKTVQLSDYLEELKQRDLAALATLENAEDLLIADQELRSLIDHKLGHSYDPRKIERISRLQHELQIARISLGAAVENGHSTAEEFFDKFNRVTSQTFQECEGILGRHDFQALFDASPEEASHLIEPTIMFGLSK